MSAPPIRRVFDRLPATRHRRAELSVAAYCSVFGVDGDADEHEQ